MKNLSIPPAPMIDILEAANDLILNGRKAEYGGPERSAETIAGVWTALLRGAGVLKDDASITPDLVCILMSGLKLGRLSANPEHLDSQVDACGYIAYLRTLQRTR